MKRVWRKSIKLQDERTCIIVCVVNTFSLSLVRPRQCQDVRVQLTSLVRHAHFAPKRDHTVNMSLPVPFLTLLQFRPVPCRIRSEEAASGVLMLRMEQQQPSGAQHAGVLV